MRNFLQLVKNLRSKCYDIMLNQINSISDKKIILFTTDLDSKKVGAEWNKLNRDGINVDYLCVPDEHVEEMNLPAAIEVIKVTDLPGLKERFNLVIFTGDYSLAWKFHELFAKIGVNFVLTIADKLQSQGIYHYIMAHIDLVYDVYAALDGADGSREIYAAALYGKVSGQISDLRYADSQQYFLNGYLPQAGDVVIDGGAFDGGNARDFSQLGCDVYSFELDSKNYSQVTACAEKYKFTPENMGLGETKGEMRYSAGGVCSRVDRLGQDIAKIIDIDTYVVDKALSRVDFIKMDIEGAELAALKGAKNSICKWSPKLAICMYHKLDDMWSIPLYLKSLNSSYAFSFRQYPIDCRFDYIFTEAETALLNRYSLRADNVKTPWETVLYCR